MFRVSCIQLRSNNNIHYNLDKSKKLIIKAINSHNPKRRYVGGLFAKPMLFIKKWFGDKMYEKAIMSQIKKATKE